MQEQQPVHPMTQTLVTWFNESLTIAEVNARIDLVQNTLKSYVEEMNKNLEAEQPTASDESGQAVTVEEIK